MKGDLFYASEGWVLLLLIRFKLYNDGKAVDQVSLAGIHLFGPDDIPVRSEMEFTDGEILGIRRNDGAVGLSTLWQVDGFGKLTLQTTRLPVRDKFYNLNVEIARSRLLRISQKREEWGLTDLTLTQDQHEQIDQSMELFIQALCHLDEPDKASKFADQSLALSLKAGESLAMAHAKLFLNRRVETGGIKRHSFGCTIDPDRMSDKGYLKQIKSNFHFVTIPVSWKMIEPKEQDRLFEKLDVCINWLSQNRIAVRIGPLLSFKPEDLPDWLFIWENDFEQVREMAYEYITSVVEHYDGKVQAWDVASGLNANNCFNFSFEQIIEITRTATLAAKRASSRSLILIELTELWGEYYARNQRTVPPLVYADAIYQSGIHFDGYGVKMGFGCPQAGMRTRDMLEMSVLLDRFSSFGKAVHISQVQVPSQPLAAKKNSNGNGFVDTGYWHQPWSEEIQAQWLDQFYHMSLSKPFVETITWAALADSPSDQNTLNGLFRADMTTKPAFDALTKLKQSLIAKENGHTSKNGL